MAQGDSCTQGATACLLCLSGGTFSSGALKSDIGNDWSDFAPVLGVICAVRGVIREWILSYCA